MDHGITRRQMLKDLGLTAGAVALFGLRAGAETGVGASEPASAGSQTKGATMEPVKEYTLPPLPYEYNALEPYIDEATLRVHHDKHHAAYVDGLNAALKKLADPEAAKDPVLVSALAGDVAFNGAGDVLHTLYWTNMRSGGGAKPAGTIAEMINRDFGSLEGFIARFATTAKKVQGSGWAVLSYEAFGKRLVISGVEKHENKFFVNAAPVLVCDVWEHAYYLKYQNKRPDYVDAFVQHLIDWGAVNNRLELAIKQG